MELSNLYVIQIPRLSQEHVAHMEELELCSHLAGRYDDTFSEHFGTRHLILDRGSFPSSAREKEA